MEKETKERMKLLLENLSLKNKNYYLQKQNDILVNDNAVLQGELDIFYKRIQLVKHYINHRLKKDKTGKYYFDNYNGSEVIISILNGTSNYAKLQNLKEFEDSQDCEVLYSD